MKFEFLRQIFEKKINYQIFKKSIHWKPSCSMRTDGRIDRYDEANSGFSAILRTRLRMREISPKTSNCLRPTNLSLIAQPRLITNRPVAFYMQTHESKADYDAYQ
jgi:hypothetical protein